MNLILWIAAIVGFFWLVGKVTSKAPTPAKGAKTTADEATEGTFYEAERQRTARRTIKLRYADVNGTRSERTVTAYAYEPTNPKGMLRAFCHLRKSQRTFRFDRIVQSIDNDTGEILPDLQATLNADWEASPETALQKLFDQHGDLLKLMYYMAKADGAARKAEVEIITQQCQELAGNTELTQASVKDALQILDLPTITGFIRTYNNMRRDNPALAIRAAEACRAIVATQKTIHPNEQQALDALK